MTNKVDKIFWEQLGKLIDEERKKRGYSLHHLSRLTGIQKQTLDHYFLGQRRISEASWEKICKALGTPKNINLELSLGVKNYK